MNITLEEAVDYLKDGIAITLHCGKYSYEISESDEWVGGDVEEGYISLVLGNVIYSDAKQVITKSIASLSENGAEVTISI